MKRNIELSLDQARELYKKCPEIRGLLLTSFKPEEIEDLPLSWDEIEIDNNDKVEQMKSGCMDILSKLIILRDIYNGNEEIDYDYYGASTKSIYVIVNQRNRLQMVETFDGINHIFAFNDMSVCEKFLNRFYKQLDRIKKYI
jgi:hypothetical protein